MFPKKGTCPSSAYKEPFFKPSFGMRWHLGERHCHIQEAVTSIVKSGEGRQAAVFRGNCKCRHKSPWGKCSSQKKLMPNHNALAKIDFYCPFVSFPYILYLSPAMEGPRQYLWKEGGSRAGRCKGANCSSSSTAGPSCINTLEQEQGRSLLFA